MTTHYGTGNQVACGRSNLKLVSVKTTWEEVSCKTCCKTDAYRLAKMAYKPLEQTVAGNALPVVAPIAFQEWLCKLRNGNRLPRGRFFVGKQAGLKAYQVGDFDVVAAYTPSEAIAVLCEHIGESFDAYSLDEVELVSSSRLNERKYFDTELERTVRRETTLLQDVLALKKPTYLYGWD